MRLADLWFDERDGVVIARVKGDVDMSNADELKKALMRSVTNEAFGVVIDLSEVVYLDSAGIHLLFELRERLKNRGQQIRLVVPPGAPVGDALELADVPAAVSIATGLDAAIEDIDRTLRDGTPGPGL
jgi:anti-anti-sigma factor